MPGAGSPSHRILVIEENVPFDDVIPRWGKARDAWCTSVWKNRARAKDLGRLIAEFLDALTADAIARMWPRAEDFRNLRDQCRRIGGVGVAKGKALRNETSELVDAIFQLEDGAGSSALLHSSPDWESPDELRLGDDGPSAGLVVGTPIIAFDCHRNCWCDSEVAELRGDGLLCPLEIKVHYIGWKKRWDEWLSGDSGRVRGQHQGPRGREVISVTHRMVGGVEPPALAVDDVAAAPPAAKRARLTSTDSAPDAQEPRGKTRYNAAGGAAVSGATRKPTAAGDSASKPVAARNAAAAAEGSTRSGTRFASAGNAGGDAAKRTGDIGMGGDAGGGAGGSAGSGGGKNITGGMIGGKGGGGVSSVAETAPATSVHAMHSRRSSAGAGANGAATQLTPGISNEPPLKQLKSPLPPGETAKARATSAEKESGRAAAKAEREAEKEAERVAAKAQTAAARAAKAAKAALKKHSDEEADAVEAKAARLAASEQPIEETTRSGEEPVEAAGAAEAPNARDAAADAAAASTSAAASAAASAAHAQAEAISSPADGDECDGGADESEGKESADETKEDDACASAHIASMATNAAAAEAADAANAGGSADAADEEMVEADAADAPAPAAAESVRKVAIPRKHATPAEKAAREARKLATVGAPLQTKRLATRHESGGSDASGLGAEDTAAKASAKASREAQALAQARAQAQAQQEYFEEQIHAPPAGTRAIGSIKLKVGQSVVALDIRQMWCVGKVVEIRHADGARTRCRSRAASGQYATNPRHHPTPPTHAATAAPTRPSLAPFSPDSSLLLSLSLSLQRQAS